MNVLGRHAEAFVGRVLSCGMDDCQEQGNYEERLKEVFDSFDASGAGSLSPEELCELCQSLHLDDATPVLQALLQNQDQLDARVDFEQFKDALILVLSSNVEPQPSEEETLSKPDSPEIQPKFVKGSKRYGRRSTPEFIEPISDHSEVRNTNLEEEEVAEDNYDSAVPRKRERWNSNESSTEEYEAEGQLRLWNPDEPSTPRGSNAAPSTSLEERLREACSQLMISWDGFADHDELLVLSEHLGLKLNSDLLQSLSGNGVMSVEEFVSRVLNSNKTQIPPASTPYRQLKRHHSTQPFDEGGRRIAPPSALTSTIGMRLFSTLDDGTGFTPVEYILDAWLDEGIENSAEILQALNFDLDGKLSLSDLTTALENELLITKNGIHQAAVASFKAEIRYLLEQVDREMKEKEKILSDLEKAEKLKNQLATEVDEHHSAIEHKNNLNLRKLEQDHKEKLSAVRSELMKEMDQLKQQAGLQREELEAEIQKIREDESFLRDHLSISVKDNRRLEIELLDSTEKLMEAESQVAKLQRSLDNIMKERFGDLDPSSADFFLQEERMKQLGAGYEAQYREMQDRIDELQAELRDFHSLGRVQQPIGQPLSEELESKSPGMESDPGIGSEEVQPFSLSLEAEMMLEQLKEQHLREMEDLRNQLQSKINDFDMMVEKHGLIHEDQKAALSLQYQQELQAMKVELASTQSHIEKLQSQLEQAELENASLQRAQAEDREVLENKREEEVRSLRQQLTEAHSYAEDLKEQLTTLSTQLVERGENHANQIEDLRKRHADEIKKLEQEHVELSEARLDEERAKMQEEKAEMEKLLDDFRREREVMQESHEDQLKARSEEAKLRFEHERDEIVERLTEQWQKERARLDEEHSESLQVLLEEEMLKLIKEHEDKENKLREQWEHNVAELQEHQEETFLQRLLQERLQLQEQFEQREKRQKEQWEMERLQLEEDYEGMLQEKLSEEREKFQAEAEEQEKRQEFLMAQVMTRHREAIRELTSKHGEERDALSSMLEKLRDDIAKERKELELSFSQRIREVEARFSGDQDSVEKRFQADVLRLEQHYQTELETLSQSHTEQKLLLDAEIQEALQKAEEQGRTMEREREQLDQQWREEMHQQESQHEKKMEELAMKNQQLQTELEELSSVAQTAELELSRQLNELHNRLQENLETRDEFLAQSERKAEEAERLLQQTLEEKEELLRSHTELEARNTEMLSVSEKQTQERIELVSECDGLKMKIEELEVLLQQAAVDFYHETKELQEHLSTLEKGLRKDPENTGKGLLVHQGLAEKALEEEEAAVGMCFEGPQNVSPPIPNSSYPLEQNVQIMAPASCAGEDDDLASKHHGNLEVKRNGWIYETDVLAGSKQEVDGESSPDCCSAQSTSFKGLDLDSSGPDENNFSVDSNSEAFFPRPLCETVVALRASEASDAGTGKTEKTLDLESCEAKNQPQDVPVLLGVNVSQDEERNQAIEDEPFMPEEVSDPDVPSPPDVQVSHDKQEVGPAAHLTFEQPSANINEERSHGLETADEGADCPLLRLQVMCDVATEENILLLKKISLLQQKTQILEKLLYHNSEKIKTGNQVLEENYSLKVKILLLMERVKELELKASEAAALQARYEDCLCENARLKYRNGELEKSVQRFERGVSRWEGFPNHSKVSLLDEIGTLREDNRKFSELLGELELQREILSAIPAVETMVDRPGPTDVEGQGATELQGCCAELEKENIGLREAIWALQDESQTLHESTQAQR
ncbi:ninein isoform X1 [Takifugu flavidus]|nr:ninein isoform X1 [Takifugu flavidus]XP_056914481.1 ninein isoform X1 [Takifugu flavidus]